MFLTAMDNLRRAIDRQDDFTVYIPDAKKAAENAQQLTELAIVLIKAQCFKEAEQILLEILEEEPSNGAAKYYMGNVSVALNRVEAGQKWFAQALETGYVNEKSLLSAALTEKALGNNRRAERMMKQAQEADPENPIPSILLYSQYVELNLFDEALKIAEGISERFPNAYVGYHAQISALFQAGKFSLAVEKLDALHLQFSDAPDYIYDYAIALCMSQRIEEAQDYLTKNEHLLDKKSLPYLRVCAHLATAQKDKDRAVRIYSDLFETYHLNSAAASLATILISEERFAEADEYLQKIINDTRRDKTYYSALYLHAVCLDQMKDENTQDAYKNAIQIYETAYSRNPLLFFCLSFAAECYRKLGDKDKAEKCRQSVEAEAAKLGLVVPSY